MLMPPRNNILNNGFIELEQYMGGDAAIIRAARICYQSEPKNTEPVGLYSCGCAVHDSELPTNTPPDPRLTRPDLVRSVDDVPTLPPVPTRFPAKCPRLHDNPGRLLGATIISDMGLISRLIHSEPSHNTVFEHAVMRFWVKCPIFVARQWLRHRMGTFNELSLRYCAAERDYFIPLAKDVANKLLAAVRSDMQDAPDEATFVDIYDNLPDELKDLGVLQRHVLWIMEMEYQFNNYEYLCENGERQEIARGILGTNTYTQFIWTVNAWSFMNWLTKRLGPAAQKEHQIYALGALNLWIDIMPITTYFFTELLASTHADGLTWRRTILDGTRT